MAITRAPRPHSNYYILDKRISEDRRLSWAARGLLVFLLGKPDHWSISVAHLAKETEGSRKPTGRDGIYALLGELIEIGYVDRIQERGEGGKMLPMEYIVSETPVTPRPLTAQPDAVEPVTADPTLVSNEVKQVLKLARTEVEIPEWLPADAWKDFVDHRKSINARLTPKAAELSIAKLQELRDQGHDPVAVINQTVQSGKWSGLFALSDRRQQNATVPHNRRNQPYQTKAEKSKAWLDELTGRSRDDNIIDI